MNISLNTRSLSKKMFLAWGLFVLLVLIWGSSFILMKRGLDGFHHLQVTALRICFACIVLITFTLSLKKMKDLPLKHWKVLLTVGLCGNLIPGTIFPFIETRIDSSIVAMLNAMTPIFTFLIAYFCFSYKANIKQVIGVSLGILGSISFTLIDHTGFMVFKPFALMTLIACLGYAISTIVAKEYLKDIDPLLISTTAIFFITPLTISYLFSTDFIERLQTPEGLKSFGYIAILGVFGTAVAMTLYQVLLKLVSPVFASSTTFVIPLVALAWGLFDGEKFLHFHILSIALILTGVYLTKK